MSTLNQDEQIFTGGMRIGSATTSAISTAVYSGWTLTSVSGLNAHRTFTATESTAGTIAATLSKLLEELKVKGIIS